MIKRRRLRTWWFVTGALFLVVLTLAVISVLEYTSLEMQCEQLGGVLMRNRSCVDRSVIIPLTGQ